MTQSIVRSPSAAFDTVDHSLLPSRLQQCVSIEGNCLAWFTSYLTNRTPTYTVWSWIIHVLEGSVLGPLHVDHSVHVRTGGHCDSVQHAFADDNQLYIHCQPDDVQSAKTNMENCQSHRALDSW